MTFRRSPALLLTLLLALQASACTVVPVSRPYYYPRETVYVAPPPPRVQYVAPAPVVSEIWIGSTPGWGSPRRDWHDHGHHHGHREHRHDKHRGWR